MGEAQRGRPRPLAGFFDCSTTLLFVDLGDMPTHGSTEASHEKCKYFKICCTSDKTTKSRSVRPILPPSSLALLQAILPSRPEPRRNGRLVTFLSVEKTAGLWGETTSTTSEDKTWKRGRCSYDGQLLANRVQANNCWLPLTTALIMRSSVQPAHTKTT